MEAASHLPEIKLTDEELDLVEVNKIIPDTWNNIAWVI